VIIVMTQRQPAGLRFNAEDMAFQPDSLTGSTAAWAASSFGGGSGGAALDPLLQVLEMGSGFGCGCGCFACVFVCVRLHLNSVVSLR